MANKKNIVIKVKYPKYGKKVEDHGSGSGMITEWNYKRIWLAISFVLMIIIALFIFMHRGEPKKDADNLADSSATVSIRPDTKTAPVNGVMPGKEAARRIKETQEELPIASGDSIDINDTRIPVKPKAAEEKDTSITDIKIEEISKKQAGIINENKVIKSTGTAIANKNVARALLTYKINNKEPVGEITTTVKVRRTQVTPVYYFTELIKMKGDKVYHQWFRNGKLVFSQVLIIAADRWRASSHKLLTYKDRGNWAVKLVNARKQLLNKKDFRVILIK
ncbi:conserved hypothetical protein [Candidatus Methylobacter favarea]|uniref:DUF2914 domain-containing protein n=1 Tax=Candidatus Methylobacter favarea TaxID=2707345 RepID=A0A8S0XTQ4_9GAMM|nr:DUF2914 domain-containing protein [Candidatus Methylobacter favarea]CAA9891856.1 conserved hypothetical protein [Candidatus Methylobacter favarea]